MKSIPTVLWVVAGAMHRADGHLLLHRRPPHKHHGGLWEFPGGKVEEGESPREALVRELAEELGIGLDPNLLTPAGFADSQPDRDGRQTVILLYSVSEWVGEPRALEDGADIAWFAASDLAVLPMPPLDKLLRAPFLT